jgi:post-segregation antitoxin (ccd killing protein)
MGKVTIYLPDDLEGQARAASLPLSALAQHAIREELVRMEAKQAATKDLEGVARRLRATIDDEEQEQRQEGHADGVAWAREYATAAELRYIAAEFEPGRGGDFQAEDCPSIVDFFGAKDNQAVISVRHEDTPYWHGFVGGATEVLEAVEKLL